MPALTPELWAQHYPRLRMYLVDRWPDIDEGRLNAIVGDFDALAQLVAATAGTSEDAAREQLGAIDVDESDIQGPGDPARPASLTELRLGPGFGEDERGWVVANLEKLNRRLQRFPSDASELEISVQQRDDTSQEVVLEAWLPKFPHMVAKSGETDLGMAIRDVRDAMWRQIDEAVNRRKEHR